MKRIIFILLGLFYSLTAVGQSVKWTTATSQVENSTYEIRFTASIGNGMHIYDLDNYFERGGPNETTFTFENGEGFELVGEPYLITKPTIKYDEVFKMDIGTLYTRAVFAQKVKILGEKAVIKGVVGWQACVEQSCLMPEDWEFNIEISHQSSAVSNEEVQSSTLNVQNDENKDTTSTQITNTTQSDDTINSLELDDSDLSNKSLWGLIGEAILWGLLAILTPCVFPMLPMTVSFFMKNGGRRRALWYGFFIVALYVLPIAIIIITTRIAGGATVTADIFNWLATHWVPNLIFFLVFMIFAASFFGAFEIVLPSGLANKTDSKSDRGGILGVLFMAMTLVLVSFSCTGPLVGTVLIRSTAGEFWTPIVTIAVFATVFALPFVFFALFPSLLQKLPKSGGWLNTVKVVLGFVELALGLKFLSVADQVYHWGILNREIYLALWIVIATLLGFYLLGKLKFKNDSEVKHIGIGRLVLAIASFTFVVYMLPGMWGAHLKGLSGYLPPITSQDFVISSGGMTQAAPQTSKHKYADFLPATAGLDAFFDFKEAQEYAESVNKPMLLYFTGRGCVNCREMESRVWSDDGIKSILANDYVVVELFLDDRKTLPESDWVTLPNGKVLKTLGKINSNWATENYDITSQPTYVIVGTDGVPLLPARGYNLDVEKYKEFLNRGVETFNK